MPGGIVDIATDPSKRFLYLLDQTSGIYAFDIDQNTGALTAIPSSPFATPWLPSFLAVDISGTHLYVAGLSSFMAPAYTLINVFSIAASGALVPSSAYYTLPQSEFPMFIAANYLYVGDSATNSVTAFSIGPSGELTQNAAQFPFGTDTGPSSIAVDPSGSLLYRATYGSPITSTPGAISAFMIDPSTGALTPAPANPQPAGIQGQIGISIDPTGRFLFALQPNGVSVYGIDATTGALSEVTGSPFPAGNEPVALSVDPTNHTVYVVNLLSSDVSEFALGGTGTLTPLAGSPVPIGSSPCCIVVVQ